MSSQVPVPADQLSYNDAARELASILADLESDRLGVDDVVARVERAGELVLACRAKISAAQAQVQRIVTQLSDAGPGPAVPPAA